MHFPTGARGAPAWLPLWAYAAQRHASSVHCKVMRHGQWRGPRRQFVHLLGGGPVIAMPAGALAEHPPCGSSAAGPSAAQPSVLYAGASRFLAAHADDGPIVGEHGRFQVVCRTPCASPTGELTETP